MSGPSDAAQATVKIKSTRAALMEPKYILLRATKSQLPSTAPQSDSTECRIEHGLGDGLHCLTGALVRREESKFCLASEYLKWEKFPAGSISST